MSVKKYSSSEAFRIALETRLQNIAIKEHIPLMRFRRQVAFDRFLCRVFQEENDTIILKGGYAIELRVATARTTKDIDLCIKKGKGTIPSPEDLRSFFQNKASLQLGDYMEFIVSLPVRQLANPIYGGSRFSVDAKMAGRLFAKFSIDVSIGDGWIESHDNLLSRDWLAFAGIPPLGFPATTVEQQLAEKIHSYTLPRQKPNSRVKDLVDIILLTQNFKINKERMAESLKRTFKLRGTHAIPGELSAPPAAWERAFSQLAQESKIELELDKAFEHFKQFFKEYSKILNDRDSSENLVSAPPRLRSGSSSTSETGLFRTEINQRRDTTNSS
jgi:hypothetical protein